MKRKKIGKESLNREQFPLCFEIKSLYMYNSLETANFMMYKKIFETILETLEIWIQDFECLA
jgi:hypothetical protein